MFYGEGKKPSINPDDARFRRWSYNVPEGMNRKWILDHLSSSGITPQTHKWVLDLCSGDGSIPAILVEDGGWKPSNITCVDQFKSPSPLVKGFRWKYFNIADVAWALRTGRQIPFRIRRLRHSYDLVTLFQSHAGMDIDEEACKFFVKPDGHILCP